MNIRNRKTMESYNRVGGLFHDILSGSSTEHALMNPWGKAALHAAAYQGHEDMVQVLLSAGADPTMADDGRTPLYFAAQQQHKGVVQILLNATARHQRLQTERPSLMLALYDEQLKEKTGELIKMCEDKEKRVAIAAAHYLVGLVTACLHQGD